MPWAASKYFLKVRQKKVWRDNDFSYAYFNDRAIAVQWLIERERAAIVLAEKNLKRNKAKLAAFIKKEAAT